MNHISDRLMAIINMITPGKLVADIGCDHGYLSIYLIENKIADKVFACDINSGPLDRAKVHIQEAGMSDRIIVRKGDGLGPIARGEVNSVVIAGMGGKLMASILDAGSEVLESVDELILGPQSDVGWFRHFLEQSGYEIISEDMIFEDSKFYPVIKAIKGKMDLQDEIFYRYGKILIKEKNPVLHQFLIKEKHYFTKLITQLTEHSESEEAAVRLKQINNDVAINARALCVISEESIFEKDRKIE